MKEEDKCPGNGEVRYDTKYVQDFFKCKERGELFESSKVETGSHGIRQLVQFFRQLENILRFDIVDLDPEWVKCTT